MGTEKEQRRRDELRSCAKAMRSLLNVYRHLLEEELRDEELTLAQLRLLYAVKEREGVSAATLGRMCEITPQSVHTLLQRAERQKWLKRSKSTKNDRIMTASLTEEGERLMQRGKAAAVRIEERLWSGVKTSTVREIREQLEAILKSADTSYVSH